MLAYAARNLKGYHLAAVDGVTDKSGSVVCFPPNDGWAYYFFKPQTTGMLAGKDVRQESGMRIIWECAGDIDGSLKDPAMWFDPEQHDPLGEEYADSDAALDNVVSSFGITLTDKAKVRMRLFRHKRPSFPGHPLLWEVHVRPGDESHWVDAATGACLGEAKTYEKAFPQGRR